MNAAQQTQEPTEEEELQKIVDQVASEYAELTALELSAKKWTELEAMEQDDRLLFPEVMYRRRAKGNFEAVNVAFRVPRDHEIRAARREAREIALADGIDQKLDADIFNQLDNVCLLWHAVRSPTPPHEPFAVDVRTFEKAFDKSAMTQAWGKLEGYRRVTDPRPAQLNREQLLALVASIAEGKQITPLHVFDGPSQAACIIFMASLLSSFLNFRSLSERSAQSTPESSRPIDS